MVIKTVYIILLFLSFSCTSSIKEQTINIDKKNEVKTVQDLVDTKDLNQFINRENTILIDVRKSEDYKKNHLKNSFNVWRPDIRNTDTTIEGLMTQKLKLETLLSNFGATNSTHIIVYDSKGNPDAARLWWILKYYGHQNVSIINGGLTAVDPSLITTDTVQKFESKSTYKFSNDIDNTLYASLKDIITASKDTTNYYILDTRSSSEYYGLEKKGNAGAPGRIPFSNLIDYSDNISYNKNQILKSKTELESIYKNVPKDKIIITYCQSGVRSALTTYVLKNILKYEIVKNYDGSWLEWSNNPELPIVQDSTYIN